MFTAKEAGILGERAAADYLRARGYTITDTNWRSGIYEIDIVARKGDTIHFIEVRSRKAGGVLTPEETVTINKSKALIKAANDYISACGTDAECSIDLIAVDIFPDGSLDIRFIPSAIETEW